MSSCPNKAYQHLTIICHVIIIFKRLDFVKVVQIQVRLSVIIGQVDLIDSGQAVIDSFTWYASAIDTVIDWFYYAGCV